MLALEIAEAFVGSKVLKRLIISCRLKPYSLFERRFRRAKLEKLWVDEFGNSLSLSPGRIETDIENPRIKNTTIGTDLFLCRSIERTMNESASVVVSDNYFLFYGKDEYFRCFSIDGKRCSPLELGGENISMFMNYIQSKKKTFGQSFTLYSLPNKNIETIIKEGYLNE
jgi:hypothetical protein